MSLPAAGKPTLRKQPHSGMTMKRRLTLYRRLLGKLIHADVKDRPPANSEATRLFVLPRTSLSDLAILMNTLQSDNESWAFMSEGRSWFRRRRRKTVYPNALMAAHQLAALGKSIEIIPVSVFWSRSPRYETSLAKLLLSERWVPTSRARRCLEALINRKMVQIVFAPPIKLGELLNAEDNPKRALRRTARLVRIVFKNQRLALLGPELSLKRRALEGVLSQPEVRLEIERRAASSGLPLVRVEKQARAQLAGMVSDFSAITLRIVYRFARWCWKWADATFEIRGFDAVRQHAQSANIVYVPCHQSHLDYIVLSYILYEQGLSLPHIAAGENLNLPVLGRLLRHCGAVFIRRSFRDDDLYRALITNYLRLILMRGHTLEFFLEGARSRTGFLMPARRGMLEITLSAARGAPPRPLVLVPVRYAYERVLDGASYASERSGAAKRSESWSDAVRSFFRLRRGIGPIGVAFGEPLRLNTADAPSAAQLANDLLRRINQQLMVTSSHLLALVFTGRQRLDISVAMSQLELYMAWLEDQGFEVMADGAESCILAGERRSLLTHERFAGVHWLCVTEKGLRLLPWHRNNALHGLAVPSLISINDAIDADSALLDVLGTELNIGRPTAADMQHWQVRIKECSVCQTVAGRALLKALLQPTLERLLLVLSALRNAPASPDSLIAECLRRASLLSAHLPEPLNRDAARLSVNTLLRASVIEATPHGISTTTRAGEVTSTLQSCLPSAVCRALSEG